MREIKSQADLDDGIKAGESEFQVPASDVTLTVRTNISLKVVGNSNATIEVLDSSSPTIVSLSVSSPLVVVTGHSTPTVWAFDSTCPTVKASDNSSPTVIARGSSCPRVMTLDYSHPTIEVLRNSSPAISVRNHSHPTIKAKDDCRPRITASGNSRPTIVASGNCDLALMATDDSSPAVKVSLNSHATITAQGNGAPTVAALKNSSTTIWAWGDSKPTVDAMGFAVLRLLGNVRQITARLSASVICRCHGPTDSIEGGQVFQAENPKTPREWCEHWGVPVIDGVATLYEAVDSDFRSRSGTVFTPGSKPVAPDWDGEKRAVGGGLYFSPRPWVANQFFPGAMRFVACPVALGDMATPPAVPPDERHFERIEAGGCREPIWECDEDANPIDEPAD